MNKRTVITTSIAAIATFGLARVCERVIKSYREVDQVDDYQPVTRKYPTNPRAVALPDAQLDAAYAANEYYDLVEAAYEENAMWDLVEAAYAENAVRDLVAG